MSAGSTARTLARSRVSLSAPTRSSHCHVPLAVAGVTSRMACGGSLSGRAKLNVIPVVRSVAGMTSVHSSTSSPHCAGGLVERRRVVRGVAEPVAVGAVGGIELHRDPGHARLVGELHGQQRGHVGRAAQRLDQDGDGLPRLASWAGPGPRRTSTRRPAARCPRCRSGSSSSAPPVAAATALAHSSACAGARVNSGTTTKSSPSSACGRGLQRGDGCGGGTGRVVQRRAEPGWPCCGRSPG